MSVLQRLSSAIDGMEKSAAPLSKGFASSFSKDPVNVINNLGAPERALLGDVI